MTSSLYAITTESRIRPQLCSTAAYRQLSARPNVWFIFGMVLMLLNSLLSCPEGRAAGFGSATPLSLARGNHSTTLLSDGTLLVAGGETNSGSTTSEAELYQPASGAWIPIAPMNVDRARHTATLLPNGKLLVAGGLSSTRGALPSAELYDPGSQTWTMTGPMAGPRYFHTATLLSNGQVLVVGGTTSGSDSISEAELYDPVSGNWSVINSLGFARFSHTATLLSDGAVLVAGGRTGNGGLVGPLELFDPGSGKWVATNSLISPRYLHTATLLPEGDVVFAGGTGNGTTAIGSTELYRSSTGTVVGTNAMLTPRFSHSATLLPNGTLFVAGGTADGVTALTNTEVYSANGGGWGAGSSMRSGRVSHTGTVLPTGEVLVVGGFNSNQVIASVERYNPAAAFWTNTGSMSLCGAGSLSICLLPNGKVLVLGGGNTSQYIKGEVYDPVTGKWSFTGPMTTEHCGASATLLPSGKVLAAGGFGGGGGGNYLASAELYDPVTGKWTLTGSLHAPRAYHAAKLLPNGLVLVCGGVTTSSVLLPATEVYNPATGLWTRVGGMNVGRDNLTASLLPNGQVLVAGGSGADYNALGTAELYDPGSGKWSFTGKLNVPRCNATATVLPSGKVLLVGGSTRAYGTGGALASAELYDLKTGTWSLTGSLPEPRNFHSALLLPNGQTLVAGGFNGTNGAYVLASAVLYDSARGRWAPTASLSVARNLALSCLLPNGKVLMGAGQGNNYSCLSSMELYDPGLGFNPSWQPQISSVFMPGPGAPVTLTGAGFRGLSEASAGNSQDSPADYPVLEVMGIDSGQAFFLPATNWSGNVLTTVPANGLPPGYLSATVFVDGIPSAAQIFKIPSLSVVSNLPASSVGPAGATLAGEVLDTGGNAPSITMYYGRSDGGTNAAAWEQSVSLGTQSGVFEQKVSGLSTNTTYYFAAKAVNSAGTSWASPSFSFTTVIPAVVTNLAASGVHGTFATVNGRVLSTGHDTPSVTLYYGTSDGGTDPAAWSWSIALGVQGGVFAQTIEGLSTNTRYFYTAAAVNAAGTNWAAPSQSFSTAATNPVFSATAVTTQHNDNGRTGMNLHERLLDTGNVRSSTFGLLYTRPVDDQIYAQPLVMTNVNILGKGAHNIVIVATVNDTVYAYDADDPTVLAPYWTNSFIAPPDIVAPNNADESAIGACGGNYQDYSGNFGIVGTPVIDPLSGTIYLVARTKEFGTNFVQHLHALDSRTGLERSNSPVAISASVPGRGAGSSGGLVSFDPLRNNQRSALTLANGLVYIGWSSHCDNGPYHGWVIAYDAATLRQVAAFTDTPDGSEGGIWMSGQGLSADSDGNVYLTTGNGTVDSNDFGESFLKLSPTNSPILRVASYFIPLTWSVLNASDADLGSAGLLLIPGTRLAISGGKQGVLYLVDRDNMGGVSSAVQSWPLNRGELHGGPVWWAGPRGAYLYVWADSGGTLRQYQFNGASFNTTPFAQGPTVGGPGSPGGVLSISANGTNAGSGIVWAVVNTAADANQAVVSGTLHAYNAENVALELWNSDLRAGDSLGSLAKFVPPTIANGKVYMATFSGRMNVYGVYGDVLMSSSGPGGVKLRFAGIPGQAYTVQRALRVTGPWTVVGTVSIDDAGMGQYSDPSPPPSEAFYRTAIP